MLESQASRGRREHRSTHFTSLGSHDLWDSRSDRSEGICPDLRELRTAAYDVQDRMQGIEGVVDLQIEPQI